MVRLKIYLIFFIFSVISSLSAVAGPFTLVIDAGHGGHDAGAVGKVAKEKNINLNVALAFGRLVEQNCADVKVIYTRKTDKFVTLQERANIANRAKADLFISIHTNAVASNKGAVAGAETYTLGMHRAADNLEVAKRENSVITMESDYKTKYQGFDPNKAESYIIFEFMQDKNMAQSVRLAKAIQQQYSSAGRKNKGVHQAGFLVLRETSMPSVLTELGFISNPAEETFLNSSEGVAKLARSIYDGFRAYRKQGLAETDADEREQDINAPMLAANAQPAAVRSDVADVPSVRPVAVTSYPGAADKTVSKARKDDAKDVKIINVSKVESTKDVAQTNSSVKDATKSDAVISKATTDASKTTAAESKSKANDAVPMFRVQLFTTDRTLRANDPRLKGLPAEYYKDGASYKYTYGNTPNYDEIVKLKNEISDKFHGVFVIALLDGKRVDLQQAIQQCKRAQK